MHKACFFTIMPLLFVYTVLKPFVYICFIYFTYIIKL